MNKLESTKVNESTSPDCGKSVVSGRFSFMRKKLLNWYRTANPTKWDDFHYHRWKDMVGAETIKEAIYKASEEQLEDLYVLREELRLGI